MAKIYTNAFIHTDPELTPETTPDQLDDCAKELERAAGEFRRLAAYLRDKKIQIQAAEGFAFCGNFIVDEIDEGRLKQSGLVVDLIESPDKAKTAVFYTDKELDEIVDSGIKTVEDLLSSEEKLKLLDEAPGSDDEDNILPSGVTIDEDGVVHIDFNMPETLHKDSEDVKVNYSINDLFHESNSEPFMSLQTKKISEDQFELSFSVKETRFDSPMISFDRNNGIFKYKCVDCDDWHEVELVQIFRNLRQAAAFMANIADGSMHLNKYLTTALGTISDDLRLLQYLIKFDYAIETDDK